MVLASLRNPASGVYVLQRICECADRVNLDLLERAWRQVAERHPQLRSMIQVDGADGWSQQVNPVSATLWRELDWTAGNPNQLSAFLRDDAERGFRFEDGPPVRFTLIQTSQGSILVWTAHHVLLDGRSILIVWRELFAIYDSLASGSEAQLPDAPDFGDHLDWLEEQDLAPSADYWRRQWQGITQTTGYVVDRIRSAGAATESGYAKESVRLSEAATQRLWDFAAEHSVTMSTLIMGAWALLLSRYSGLNDIVFGVTRDCRHSPVPRAEEMVGLFINTVPVRVTVDPHVPMAAWLKEIRAAWVGMRPHEHTPLDKILGWSNFRPECLPSTRWWCTITSPHRRRLTNLRAAGSAES